MIPILIITVIKEASERFGDPAFLDSLVFSDQGNKHLCFWFDKTTFFIIRTKRLLLKLSKAALMDGVQMKAAFFLRGAP